MNKEKLTKLISSSVSLKSDQKSDLISRIDTFNDVQILKMVNLFEKEREMVDEKVKEKIIEDPENYKKLMKGIQEVKESKLKSIEKDEMEKEELEIDDILKEL